MAIAYKTVRALPDVYKAIIDITLDASYASGGYALSNSSLGMLAKPDMLDFEVRTGDGFVPRWDQANNKLKMFKVGAAGALTECVNTDLTASVVVRAEVTGTPIL